MNPPDKIVAYMADGEDSVVAINLEGQWMPLVFARPKDAKMQALIDAAAQSIADMTGKTIRRYEFTSRIETAAYPPTPKGTRTPTPGTP